MFAYSPPYKINKETFFMELKKSLCSIARNYENKITVGDLPINFVNLKRGDTHSHMFYSRRNQEFFRAEEVSENKGTSINIQSATYE